MQLSEALAQLSALSMSEEYEVSDFQGPRAPLTGGYWRLHLAGAFEG